MLRTVPIVILVAAAACFGQKPVLSVEGPQSNIGIFSEQTEALLQRQIIEIGTIRNFRVQAITVTDLLTGARAKGARFEMTVAGSGTSPRQIRSTTLLDPDEVDNLIKSIDYLRNNVFNTSPETFTDVAFVTRDGLSLGAAFYERNWHGSITMDRTDANSTVGIRIEDISLLFDFLQQVKAKLR